jgi:dnd system-associated protein 4
MPDRRIRFSKDKVDFIKSLTTGDQSTGPFRTQADVLAFAAALGANRNFTLPFEDAAKEPIRQDIFERAGHDSLINLLAVTHSSDPMVLADSDEMEDKRITIFEEYANGGLQILQEELKGSVDYLRQLLLIITDEHERGRSSTTEDAFFDLSRLIE